MQRKIHKNDHHLDCHKSNTSTPTKKSKSKSIRNIKESKLNTNQLSEAFYSKQNNTSIAKIVFFD